MLELQPMSAGSQIQPVTVTLGGAPGNRVNHGISEVRMSARWALGTGQREEGTMGTLGIPVCLGRLAAGQGSVPHQSKWFHNLPAPIVKP